MLTLIFHNIQATHAKEDTDKPSSASVSALAFFIEAGVLAAIIVGLITLSGWAFADHWFAAMGLTLSEMEPGSPLNYIAFAVWAFRDAWLIFLAIVALTIALIAGGGIVWGAGRLWQPLVGLAIPLVLLILAIAAIEIGQAQGAAQAKTVLIDQSGRSLPSITLTMKPGDSFDKECLKRVYQDKNAVFVMQGYVPLSVTPSNKMPTIYRVNLSQVLNMKITKDDGLCGR